MELKALMELKSPTVEQFSEMESILGSILKEVEGESARLEEEHRAHSCDRVLGIDDGLSERSVAQTVLAERRADISHVLVEIRGKKANLECRLAKEADDAAWEKVKTELRGRRSCMKEIEELLAEVVGLAWKQGEFWGRAVAVAPIKLDRDAKEKMPRGLGGHPGDFHAAIVARLNLLLQQPFPAHAPIAEFDPFTRRVAGDDGLISFLGWSEDAILRR